MRPRPDTIEPPSPAQGARLPRGYLRGLFRAYHASDPGGAAHSAAVCRLAVALSRRLGLADEAVVAVAVGAVLHDVGKAGVPSRLLTKPEPLLPDEWAIVREHPRMGHAAVARALAHPGVLAAVRSHHERPDGSGYPDGLPGPRTPLAARIVAVADAFSAMTEERPYRVARRPDEALAEVKRCTGTQFDPGCVEALDEVVARGRRRAAPLTA